MKVLEIVCIATTKCHNQSHRALNGHTCECDKSSSVSNQKKKMFYSMRFLVLMISKLMDFNLLSFLLKVFILGLK